MARDTSLRRANPLDNGVRVVGVERKQINVLLGAGIHKMVLALLGHTDIITVAADDGSLLRCHEAVPH
jgi:hypothetical protein